MSAIDAFEIRVQVLGPEVTRETAYGPRTDRETLATLDVPVDSLIAWTIFQRAAEAATRDEVSQPVPEHGYRFDMGSLEEKP